MDDRQVIEWDKDDIDALGFMKGRCAGARDAELHAPRVRVLENDKGIKHDLATNPGRRSRDLCDDQEGRYLGRLPDRVPRADVRRSR